MINLARRLLKGAAAFLANRVQAISGHSTGTQQDIAYGCAVDSGGNYLLSGYINVAAPYVFLAKFDASQSLPWQRKQSMTARFISNTAIGIDSSDNVYMAGQGYVTASPNLPHLFKYNSSGTLQWQRKLTSASDCSVVGLVTSAAGDSYVLINVIAPTPYTVLAKYNTSGTLQWQRKLTSTYRVSPYGLAFASDGGLLLVGYFYDGANAAANSRGIIVKYDTTGAIQWQYKVHWAAQGTFLTMAADSTTGDIYLAGANTISAVSAATFIKINSAGSHQWTRRHPTTGSTVTAMSVDATTGYLYFQNSAAGVSYLVCMDADGGVVWERTITADAGAVVQPNLTMPTTTQLLVTTRASHTSVSQGDDAVLLRMPLNGGPATVACDYIDIATPSATSYTTPAAPTVEAAGLTDAAGDLTDAAGSVTDAAGTMTFTTYTS